MGSDMRDEFLIDAGDGKDRKLVWLHSWSL